MKRLFLMAGCILLFILANGQSKIKAIPDSKGIIVQHKTAPKEGLYYLSRIYDVKVDDIAAASKIDKNKSLLVGEIVKIPLPFERLSQSASKGTPVYYEVGEKEGLMTVSNKFNKALLKNLRSWNKLQNDKLTKGQQLIIGYVFLNEEPLPVGKAESTEKPIEKNPTEHKPVEVAVEKPQPKPVEEVVTLSKPEPPKPEMVQELRGKGYFKGQYTRQSHEGANTQKTVTSGIFKANKGWGDGKYYVLIDEVKPGTIIKITNPENNAIIYAKVLGQMKGIKQNEGLDIRISDAAVSELAVSDSEKFIVSISY